MTQTSPSRLRIIQIDLDTPSAMETQVRLEAARLWNRLVKIHRFCRCRRRKWPTESALEKHFKGRFALHSQTIQAIVQKFMANIDGARTKRREGDKHARYPWRSQHRYQTVTWKQTAIKRRGKRRLALSNGKGRKPLVLTVPSALPDGAIVQAELLHRRLTLTIKVTAEAVVSAGENIVAGDLGLIHLGVFTDGEASIAVVGRGLRSLVQHRNKKLAALTRRMSKTQKGSRRWRKLRVSKARLLRRFDHQVRNLLHHAGNQIIDFCVARQAGTLVVGDITNIARHKRQRRKGSRRLNQSMSGNPLGRLVDYLRYKGARRGVQLLKINEAYTSQHCPACGHRHKPAGRVYRCTSPSCSFAGIRDEVGATNILVKHRHGRLIAGSQLPTGSVKYRRPVALRRPVVDRLTCGMWPEQPAGSDLAA